VRAFAAFPPKNHSKMMCVDASERGTRKLTVYYAKAGALNLEALCLGALAALVQSLGSDSIRLGSLQNLQMKRALGNCERIHQQDVRKVGSSDTPPSGK